MTRRTVDSIGPNAHHAAQLRAIAAHGLAGSLLVLPEEPLDDAAFLELLGKARIQRLTGLVWQSIVDGAFAATDEQVRQAEWLHVQALSGALVLERLLLETVAALDAADIPVRVLKGTAAAHLDYAEPSHRGFGDVDLLVPGPSFDRAVEVLRGQGHRRLHPEPRPGFDRRFSKGTSFRTTDGLEIDLHRTFTMGPLGIRLDIEGLWSRCDEFALGDQVLRALSPEERFLHACYHAVLGEVVPRLTPLRDVAQLALTRQLDLVRVHELIRSSRGEAVVSRAVRYAWEAFDIADVLAISAWAQTYRTDPREAAELAVYGEGSTYARKAIASIRALPTMGARAAYVYALAAPRRSYLDDRYDGRLHRLRNGLRRPEQEARR